MRYKKIYTYILFIITIMCVLLVVDYSTLDMLAIKKHIYEKAAIKYLEKKYTNGKFEISRVDYDKIHKRYVLSMQTKNEAPTSFTVNVFDKNHLSDNYAETKIGKQLKEDTFNGIKSVTDGDLEYDFTVILKNQCNVKSVSEKIDISTINADFESVIKINGSSSISLEEFDKMVANIERVYKNKNINLFYSFISYSYGGTEQYSISLNQEDIKNFNTNTSWLNKVNVIK